MFFVGQKVCLWQIDTRGGGPGELLITKEVIVTITETKTGVLGEFSRQPVASQSLRAVDENGNVYEKHWDFWPESQSSDFSSQWSTRYDGKGFSEVWSPMEATSIYDLASKVKVFTGLNKNPLKILDSKTREPMTPKGDVEYCQEHDRFTHKGVSCFVCLYKKSA